MRKKIIGIFVCMLLFVTSLSLAYAGNINEVNNIGNGLINQKIAGYIDDFQLRNNVIKTTNYGIPFYGYCIFDPGGGIPEGPCSFYPTSPGSITSIAPTSISSFISGGTWADGTWYGCEHGSSGDPYIWIIDENTGDMTLVGNYDSGGTGLSLNGLAFDTLTDTMFGCSSTDLYTINMVTGASTHVGPFNLASGYHMIGIAFDREGNLYGVTVSFNLVDNLYLINTSTGAVSIVGSTGLDLDSAQDMAFDLDTGILYLAACVDTFHNGKLYTCNTVTGYPTLIGPFQNSAQIAGFAIPYNQAPNKPNKPSGTTEGNKGEEYTFHTYTSDPEGDDVYYLFDWDDGTDSGWIGPFPHGTTQNASHKWAEGKYGIRVKAKDINGGESEWSDYLIVTMPKNKAYFFNFPLLNWLFERFPNTLSILKYIMGLS